MPSCRVASAERTLEERTWCGTPSQGAKRRTGEPRRAGARRGNVPARVGPRLSDGGRVRILRRSGRHDRGARAGTVLTSAFELLDLPRTVRVPDIAFVASARLSRGEIPTGFIRIPPDLAVEILSPSERRQRIQSKLEDYRAVRIPLVWVVDPGRRAVTVIAPDREPRALRQGDVLDGGAVLPGFTCPIAEIFEGLR